MMGGWRIGHANNGVSSFSAVPCVSRPLSGTFGEGGVCMGEADFWVSLEFRLCHEFAGLPERRYQYFWCDGFIPGDYVLDGSSPRITGRCWWH